MIRSLVFFIALFVLYHALKTIVRSAVKSYYHEDAQRRSRRTIGDDMVQDPECLTYVLKDRAVTRRIRGTLTHFCSDACAGRYEDKNRS